MTVVITPPGNVSVSIIAAAGVAAFEADVWSVEFASVNGLDARGLDACVLASYVLNTRSGQFIDVALLELRIFTGIGLMIKCSCARGCHHGQSTSTRELVYHM